MTIYFKNIILVIKLLPWIIYDMFMCCVDLIICLIKGHKYGTEFYYDNDHSEFICRRCGKSKIKKVKE